MKGRAKLGLVGAAALAVASIAGCGNNTTGQTTKSSSKPLVIVPSPEGSFQKNFNPFSGNANYGTQGLFYEPLFYYSNVSPQQYPILGKQYTWSNGNKTLTVDLQTNAKWSDGQAFTAKDVVFTFNMLQKYPAADTNGVWKELDSISANGDNQVVFQFKNANVPFAYYVLGIYIVPEHIWSSLGDPSKATIANPVGTGPYLLDTFNSQDYKMKANPSYYGGTPPVKELNFPAYSSNDSANLALANGEIDWAGLFLPNIDQVYTSKSPHNKYWFPPSNIVTLYTNLKDPILGQLPVRKAISMAIDRNQLSQKGEYGYEPVASPTGLTLPNDQAWIDPNLPEADKSFTYDPAGAQKVLEDAGYKKNSSGIFESPSGKPLSFTLEVVSGWSDWDADCSLIAQQLKQIGIDVKVQQEQYGAYYANLTNHTFQMAVSWTNAGPGPYYQYENLLSAHGNFNNEQWNDPATEKALSDFATTTDKSTQQQSIYKLEHIMAEQLPSIPLVYGAIWYEYNDANYTGWPSQIDPYANPAPFAWPAPEVVLMHLKPR